MASRMELKIENSGQFEWNWFYIGVYYNIR